MTPTRTKNMQILSIVIKVAAIIGSIYGMIITVTNVQTFTYFTILSNIWIDLILFVFLILDIRDLIKGKETPKSNVLYIIKYVLTVSITITGMVFMFLLAPMEKGGFFAAYFGRGASGFALHFWTPVLAIIDMFLFDQAYRTKKIHACFAMIPALTYFGAVIIMGQCGMRWREGMIAPYNFINYAAPTGWFGFDPSQASLTTLGIGVAYMVPVLVLFFWALGLLYLKIIDSRKKRALQKNAK